MSTNDDAGLASREVGLKAEQKRFWDENGFLILPSFFPKMRSRPYADFTITSGGSVPAT